MTGVSNNIQVQIDNLQNLINTIQQNVNFNLGLTWAIMAAIFTLVVAVAGICLNILARSWVEKSVKQRIPELKDQIRKELKMELQPLKGSVNLSFDPSKQYVETSVTLPKSFSRPPMVFVGILNEAPGDVRVTKVTNGGFMLKYLQRTNEVVHGVQIGFVVWPWED